MRGAAPLEGVAKNAEAVEARDRAYFNKHAWAVAIYYSLGRLDAAGEQLRTAASLYPEGIATGRFIRSMINAKAQAEGVQPSQEMVQEAVRLVLREAKLPRQLRATIWKKQRDGTWRYVVDGGSSRPQ